MPKGALHMLAAVLWLSQTADSLAVSVKPQAVQDLQYGEVLFHFYQQDYFNAITRLMVAQEQDRLPHHRDEAELLLGGMQLSYGLLDEARDRFSRLLDEDSDARVRNRAWYYLARLAYQRGEQHTALDAIARVKKPGDRTVAAETALLDANIHMQLGQNAEAASLLEKARAPKEMQEYLQINRGIALLRAGKLKEGRRILDKVGRTHTENEELLALRDRANLGLGYELIRAGDAAAARQYLNRVRVQSPFVHAALLGAGWADAETGDYRKALGPWLSLLRLGDYEPAVQEAHLAVPYAFSRLGDVRRATYYYERAIDYFDDESRQLQQAIDAVRGDVLLRMLGQVDTTISGGWLNDNAVLKEIPAGRYLVEVLAGDAFQETLKDYRDLGYLQNLLQQSRSNIELYHDMVDTRRQAYEQRAPGIRKRLQENRVGALEQRWRRYQSLVEKQRAHGDPLALANGKELKELERLDSIDARLAKAPHDARLDRLRERARWLRGILYWQVQDDFKARLWNTEKQLRETRTLLDQAGERRRRLTQALESARTGFDGYDERIETVRKRIDSLIPRIAAARSAASENIRRLALKELELRKQRLASYRSQARYALARSYDQLSQQHGEKP